MVSEKGNEMDKLVCSSFGKRHLDLDSILQVECVPALDGILDRGPIIGAPQQLQHA